MDIVSNFYFGWGFYNFLIISLFIFYISRKKIKLSQYKYFVLIYSALFLILAVFGSSITADYWPYREIVDTISTTKDPFVHVESFYKWWVPYVDNNYQLYLLILFFSTFLIFYFVTCFLNPIDIVLFLFSYSVLFLYNSIAGRQILFNMFYVFTILLFLKKYWLPALFSLLLCFYLHKVAILGLPILLLLFIPLNRRTVIFIIFLFIGLSLVLRYIINNYLGDVMMGVKGVDGANYLTKEEGANAYGSLWWKVIYIYQISVKYLLAFWVLFVSKNYCFSSSSLIVRVMYRLLFWVILISLLLYSLNMPDNTIAGRCFGLAIIPTCYLLSNITQFCRVKFMFVFSFCVILIIYMMFNNAYIVGVSHGNLI